MTNNNKNELIELFKDLFGLDLSDVASTIDSLLDEYSSNLDEEKEEKTPARPSEKIKDVNVGLNIHKLVQGYVDEYIKPSFKDASTDTINDIYAGLYEFACYIYTK